MKKFTKIEMEVLSVVPNDKVWFSLKECCSLKGLNYKTSCNRTELQPNEGKGYYVGGKKVFRRDVVMEWLLETDYNRKCS